MRLDNFNDRLSAKELLDISQEISKHFSPVFETKIAETKIARGPAIKLSAKELFDISEEISREFTPDSSLAHGAKLVLLAVDPGHLHAYWHGVKEQADISPTRPEPEKLQLTLRLYDWSEPADTSSKTVAWHDIGVQDEQTQHKIPLPLLTHNTAYSAAIGECHPDGHFVSFVHSNLVDAYSNNSVPCQSRVHTATLQAKPENADKNASGLGACKLQ
jgi:hypothetical protein